MALIDESQVLSLDSNTPEAQSIAKSPSEAELTADKQNIKLDTSRYADVLLMLAEAIGEGSEAYGLINEVRGRAGLGTIDSSTPGSFEEKLLQERRIELAFENHRWADLLRFGVADSVMKATGKDPNGRLLVAIPQRELDLNKEFVQDPGY